MRCAKTMVVLLRLRLLRGGDGVQLDQAGTVTATGRGAEDGLTLGDRILSELPLPLGSICDVSIIRDDSELARALCEHGLVAQESCGTRCFRALKLPVRCALDNGSIGLTMTGLRVDALADR